MKIIFAMHGKPKDKRILELLDEYQKKISRYQKIDFNFLGEFSNLENLLEKFVGKKVYLLDEDGKEFSSLKFAENYEKDLNNGEKEIVFVVGPAEGFGNISKLKNINIISLSKMAMQHDIAALVLMEQIYRSVSIKNNLPYHKI